MTAILDRDEILRILDTVTDPEIPVLTVRDLGIIREVHVEGGEVEVVITPTYSGCPAMHMIEIQIMAALREAGITELRVRTVLSPAWTTAWISAEGREKLERYGIAPPREQDEHPPCPRCGDKDTRLLSQFGSTACKALWQCNACKEPFDYFKCH
jgi:ring-1,2-phenylacetyl-CoA epoxidase subunit PaaD